MFGVSPEVCPVVYLTANLHLAPNWDKAQTVSFRTTGTGIGKLVDFREAAEWRS
jgi:hypothetical protein